MSIRNLDKIFEPHRIAVIGASDTPTSVGYTVLRNLVGSGFRGVVYPVNAKREATGWTGEYLPARILPPQMPSSGTSRARLHPPVGPRWPRPPPRPTATCEISWHPRPGPRRKEKRAP